MGWAHSVLASPLVLASACLPPPIIETDTTGGSSGSNTDAGTTSAGNTTVGNTNASTTDPSSGPGPDSSATGTTADPDSSSGDPAICGDGMLGGMEACDDGNTDDGDGCSSACDEELGYGCSGQPSICETTCGDGAVAGEEACDDGERVDGDGCDSSCAVELYSRCEGESPSSCAPIRIIYAPADIDDEGFRSAIAMITGGPVDYADARATTPTLADLLTDYDCVFTNSNYTYHDSEVFGATLADFVDGGGTVVLGIVTNFHQPTGLRGSPIMQADYAPVTNIGNMILSLSSYTGDGTSPLHTGVTTYGAIAYDNDLVLQGMGIQDSTFDVDEIAVAYRPDFKVVYVNGTGNASFSGMGDWDRLIANACAVGFL